MTSVEEEERWKQCRMAGEETSSIYQGGYHENRLIGFGGWLNGIVSFDAVMCRLSAETWTIIVPSLFF